MPLLAIAAAALLFLAPALYNHYPLVFSDTGGFLEQALLPDSGWDKPWVYGPLLTPFHATLTLWPAAYAQCLLLSALLWCLQPRHPARHLALCATLTAASAAPWFASLLMPDILAPITVLALYLLATASTRSARLALGTVATLAIAAHLAHLVLAAACIAILTALNLRSLRHVAPPLAAAIALLLATNLVAHQRLAISPYGADFALARLVADGPARQTIQENCPQAAWHVCAWRDRLPTNADDFLWDPNGPVWADGYGPLRIAPEAGLIVRATLLAHPVAVARAAMANTLTQLPMLDLGDTLIADHLDPAVLDRIRLFFPPAEALRLAASRQFNGTLDASSLIPGQRLALSIGTLATIVLAVASRRYRALALLILVALLANAFSTGALSGPHHRYQARIAWLVLLPPLLALLDGISPARAPLPPRPATGGSFAG